MLSYLEVRVSDARLDVRRAQPLQGGLPHLHVAGAPQLRRGLASLEAKAKSGSRRS